MSVDATVRALLAAWPALAGEASAAWPDGYWRLRDLLRAYLEAQDAEGRATIGRAVLAEMRNAPSGLQDAFRRELRAVQEEERLARERGQPLEEIAAGLADARAQAARLLAPEAVARYTDIQAPAQAQVGRRFAVIVGLTRAPSEDAREPQELQAELNKLIKVVLAPRPPLEALGEREKTLRIEPDRDSEPVVFYLRAHEAGAHSILIDFYDSRMLLISQTIALEAAAEAAPEALTKPAGASLRVGDYLAPPPDLILRVSTQGNRLSYHLHFADMRMVTIEGETLGADPRTYRLNLMREIEGLREQRDVDGRPLRPAEIMRQLERIGQRLYRRLFPEALRREYCRFRERVRTLEIISDEPWIPWELVRPYELDGFDGPGFEDDFLCARFDLARWVMPGAAPAAEIAVQSLACVAPLDSGLVEAQAEREFVRALAQSARVDDTSPAAATRAQVIGLFEGDRKIALWHFVCHGDYRADDVDNSPLVLQGKDAIRPNDLIGPAVERRLSGDRPLVFLNACRVGRLGLSLAGLGGWARTLLGDCRVGALIAPLWKVTDGAARCFAEAFYTQSQQPGRTLAQALRQARQATRAAFPDDLTWLAYTLYAHPNARLKWP